MSNFYNRCGVLWFPLMKKPSEKSYRYDPRNKGLRLEYGPHVRYLPPALVAELTGKSVKTVYKWINGTHPIDPAIRQVLYTRALGLLPHDQWRAWHIDENGRLTAPNGYTFRPDELMGLSVIKQLNGALQADVARLTIENRELRAAVDYLQANGIRAANVVPFPQVSRYETKKKPG